MALTVFLFPLVIGVAIRAMIGRLWILPMGAAVGVVWMLVTAFNGGFGGDVYHSNDMSAGFNAAATAFLFVVIVAGMAIGNRAHSSLFGRGSSAYRRTTRRDTRPSVPRCLRRTILDRIDPVATRVVPQAPIPRRDPPLQLRAPARATGAAVAGRRKAT
ncbi:MAG: hypothetical protein QOH12_2198 [Solirubrobacteraceae bacterium]|jgi:hypothetical protein|nr:hypothetical protein [Solirubrobacteraceae bacterium]